MIAQEALHRHQRFPQAGLAATEPAATQSSETLVVDHHENSVVLSFPMAGSPMTLEEILQSIHALEGQLRKFEEQYRLRSEDFYRLVQEGRLEQSLRDQVQARAAVSPPDGRAAWPPAQRRAGRGKEVGPSLGRICISHQHASDAGRI